MQRRRLRLAICADAADGLAEDAGVVAAAQAAVGGEHQQQAVLDLLALLPAAGASTLAALALRSAASSAILRVYASASVARSSAFLKRAVAISSIVRVILRMLRIALRRLTRARVLAMESHRSAASRCGTGESLCISPPAGSRLIAALRDCSAP